MLLSIFVLHSCQKDDDLHSHDHNSRSAGLPFDFKHFTINGKTLEKESPLVSKKINKLNGYSISKSGLHSSVILDTTSIIVLESQEFSSYIFRVNDSTLNNQEAKNYVLMKIRDTVFNQYMVHYRFDMERKIDTALTTIEPIFGDDLLNQTQYKCGGFTTQVSWVEGYTLDFECSGSGKHVVGDGEYDEITNPQGCKLYGTKGQPRQTVVAAGWRVETIAAKPCSGGGGGGISFGAGVTGDPSDDPVIGNDPDSNDDPDNDGEEQEVIGVGIVENLKPLILPCPGLKCKADEKVDIEECACIAENCEYKYGYLHESAFENDTASFGDNSTTSSDNFRNEFGIIDSTTNCNSGKIDSGSSVKVTGPKEQRSYTNSDGTTGTSSYYPITYLDCPKGNKPGNPDYDEDKPCSDCNSGDPVKDMEIQEQLTACGTKGGMYGYTRGVAGGCITKRHGGVDIKNDYGDSVHAMFDGDATLITDTGGAGHYVKLTSNVNGNTIITYYFHLQQLNRVSGQVKAGDIIGYQGDSGNLANGILQGTTESHVHIKVRENGIVVDPITFFKTEINENTGSIISSNCN